MCTTSTRCRPSFGDGLYKSGSLKDAKRPEDGFRSLTRSGLFFQDPETKRCSRAFSSWRACLASPPSHPCRRSRHMRRPAPRPSPVIPHLLQTPTAPFLTDFLVQHLYTIPATHLYPSERTPHPGASHQYQRVGMLDSYSRRPALSKAFQQSNSRTQTLAWVSKTIPNPWPPNS